MNAPNKRRATRQIRKLLETVEKSYASILNSKRYCEFSQYRNKDKFLQQIRDIEVSHFATRAILRWVLMDNLTAEELKYVPTEIEGSLNAPD